LARLVTPGAEKQKILEDIRKQIWQFHQERYWAPTAENNFFREAAVLISRHENTSARSKTSREE
jgi:hypothetical protein